MKTHQNVSIWALCLLIIIIASCQSGGEYLTPGEIHRVKDGVTQLTTHIANDVSKKGPEGWVNYFDDSPEFFMADEGGLPFKDYTTAVGFIRKTLVKNIKHISLNWSNVRIDVLSTDIASIGADFHEDVTGTSMKINKIDGYFTATALFNGTSWKLRNLHWSVKAPVPNKN